MGSQLDFYTTLKKNNLLETSTVSRYNIQLIKRNCLRKRGQQGNRSHTLEGFSLLVEWFFCRTPPSPSLLHCWLKVI